MELRSLFWIPVSILICGVAARDEYRGKPLGKLSQLHHGVSGDVYVVDARTLHIRNFHYDGEGPAAYFYAGSSKTPGNTGFRLRDERGTNNPLPRYRGQDITISLPEGKSLQNIRWLSVWCEEFAVNFGDVRIPKGFDFPRPHKLGALSGIHGVSSDQIVIVDAQTLLIPNFSYDGEAPDAKFWVGQGSRPTPQGVRIPDENGKIDPLRRYDRKTIVLTLPGDMTVYDIGHFGVWCEAFTVDFGHVLIPQGLNVPPSLKMLGVSPQSKLNCEVLWDDLAFEVRWAVAGDSIVLQLVARLDAGEYMAFGISGDDKKSQMVGGDVTVAWVDKNTLKGQAKDYYLDAKSQCSGTRGSCPDENLADKTNSVRLLNAALVNGYSIVTYQRSLKPQDEFDLPVFTNGTQPIIWAIGPLNAREEVSYHSLANRADILLDFGRPPKWNCPTPEAQNVPNQQPEPPKRPSQQSVSESFSQSPSRREPKPKPQPATPAPVPKSKPWHIPPIQCDEPEDGTFFAQMGPTGGKQGYPAITGHVGWGISWYINGLLIPEINVVRGRTYTFFVEGGIDPDVPARYHPFYITDDPVGGYEYKTPEERAKVRIFAGAEQNNKGEVRPTGVGRLCNWVPDQNHAADDFASFGAYQRTLQLVCDKGDPGIVQWTVTQDTPDTVYYQCFTHRYLGWKINVLDKCEESAGSEVQPVFVRPPQVENKILEVEPEAEASIQHETKVRPNQIPSGVTHYNKQPVPETSQVTYVPVPQFTFYNEETGEPLDQETIHKMNLDREIERLQAQFYQQAAQQESNQDQFFHQGAQQESNQEQFFQKGAQQEANQDSQFFQKSPQQESNKEPQFFEQSPQSESNQDSQFFQKLAQKTHDQFSQQSAQKESKDEQFLNFFHTPKPMYSVEENPEDDPPALPANQFQLTPQTERPTYVPVTKAKPMQFEDTTLYDEVFNKEFLKNYHQLQAEAAAKLKKYNQKLHHSKPNRLQYSAPRRPMNSHHALTLQQRPLPPGMFRPPFLPPPPKKSYQKRPVSASSQKVNSYAHINNIPNRPINYHRPQNPHPTFPPQVKTPQVHVQQVLALQKLISTMKPQEHSSIIPSTPIYVDRPHFTEPTPLAVNTGFNPNSVKVEGGFKPIINTGIAPSFKTAEERMDDTVDEANIDDTIGVIDLTKQETQAEEVKKDVHIDSSNKTEEEEKDIFKHLTPVKFEPMFVPSPLDHRMQKNPNKLKKKVVDEKYQTSIKHRNNHLEPYNAQKNKYIKMRPRPTLIRRPLYPNNVMPPFKIPSRGGSPQFRYQQNEEDSIEDTTDFEIIPMSNETSHGDTDSAQNILDVIEMQSENNGTEPSSVEIMVLNTDDGEILETEFQVKNETEDEIAMAAETRNFYSLPDGKRVSVIAPPAIPQARFDISKQPQFAPFRGELPSFPASVADLPQLTSSKAARGEILPPGHSSKRARRSPDHVPGHVGDDHDHYDSQHHDDHHNHDEHHEHSEDKPNKGNSIYSGVLMVPLLAMARFL